jgi:hypothetical protein
MRRPPTWSAWLLVAVLAVVSGYLKFNRELSPLIYLPLVTVPALVVGYFFGGLDEDGRTETIEPEQSPE